jgi:hypothetical protein
MTAISCSYRVARANPPGRGSTFVLSGTIASGSYAGVRVVTTGSATGMGREKAKNKSTREGMEVNKSVLWLTDHSRPIESPGASQTSISPPPSLTLTSPFSSLHSPLSPHLYYTHPPTDPPGHGLIPLKIPRHPSFSPRLPCLQPGSRSSPCGEALDRRLQRSQLAEPHPIRWSRSLLLSSRASVSSRPPHFRFVFVSMAFRIGPFVVPLRS